MDREARFELAIHRAIDAHIDQRTPQRLVAAIDYAVFPGGHRIRPKISLCVAEACGMDDPDLAVAIAAALELMHCASLVHDDMPCFDNAATRRGKPSVHSKFGESLALLTGDALIVLAYQILSASACRVPSRLGTLMHILGSSVGLPRGIVAGQAWECEDEVDISTYHRAKTGALFAASTMAGAAASGVPHDDWAMMGKWLGQAYQVADDLLDYSGEAEVIGKPTGQDGELDRPNLVHQYGIAKAKARLEELVAKAEASVPDCPGRARLLTQIRIESQAFVSLAMGSREAA